jgi:hypothetical protein
MKPGGPVYQSQGELKKGKRRRHISPVRGFIQTSALFKEYQKNQGDTKGFGKKTSAVL